MIVQVFNSSIVSGPETLVIPSLPRLGEEVVVIFLSETRCGDRSAGPPAYTRSFGLKAIEIEVRSRWDSKAVKELRETLRQLAPRIVHAHEVKAAAYVAAARTTDRKYKLVTTNHGVRAKKAPTLRFYEWIYTHLIMRRFDRVLSVCSSDRKLLIDRGVPAAKVAVHLNGVDRPKISPELRAKESARIRAEWNLASLGIGPRSICLGLVGRLAPEKRHSYIMQAMKELRAAHSEIDAHLIIFGIGAMGDALKAESEALGLSDCVHWMGYRGTVGSEMAGFDVLVSLSSAEGLPVNLVEAGWAATPVFATAVDGNLDLVPSPEYGTLVSADASVREAAQKLAQTLSDPTALQKTGINLQRRIEELFSGVVWVERLKEFYR